MAADRHATRYPRGPWRPSHPPTRLAGLRRRRSEVLRAMAGLFVESIFGLYRTRARRDRLMGGECGAVTFVQRFGGSLNLNVHMHVVVLDGVFVRDAGHGVVFHAAPPPTLVDLEAIVRRVRDRALSSRTARRAESRSSAARPLSMRRPTVGGSRARGARCS